MTKRALVAVGSLLVACSSVPSENSPTRQPSAATTPRRTYEIYGRTVALHDQEVVPKDEPAAINSLNDIMMGLFKKEYASGHASTDPETGTEFKGTRRGVHPRGHACVVGKLKVNDTLKDAAGLFQPGAQYDVTMRFSNGSPIIKDNDIATDTRGFGMKVWNVTGDRILPGEDFNTGEPLSQDFTLNNTEPFFADDAAHYAQFMHILTFEQPTLEKAAVAFVKKLALEGHPITAARVAEAFKGIQTAHTTTPLGIDYYSITAFQHGEAPDAPVVKYKIEPCNGDYQDPVPSGAKLFLKANLVKHLKTQNACFKFEIQHQLKRSWSVENPSYAWDTKKSPYSEIARIEIPSQEIMDEMACEKMIINPWDGLAAHKPLGGINRIRLPTYLLSVERRKQTNHY